MNENCMTYVNCTTQPVCLLYAQWENRSVLENMILLSSKYPPEFQHRYQKWWSLKCILAILGIYVGFRGGKRFNILIPWFDGSQACHVSQQPESEVHMVSNTSILGTLFPFLKQNAKKKSTGKITENTRLKLLNMVWNSHFLNTHHTERATRICQEAIFRRW